MVVKQSNNDPKQTELAPGFTVANYEAACTAQDRDKISDALHSRFTSRYIEPVTSVKGKPTHGFTVMAIACLMIESLETFRQGWENSDGKSKAAFCYFFDRQDLFSDFRGYSAKFYKNVRCGILHQAETTGGWKITRRNGAPLLDTKSSGPTINATLFMKNLRSVLDEFCEELKTADWDATEWKSVRKKMKALCNNCRP